MEFQQDVIAETGLDDQEQLERAAWEWVLENGQNPRHLENTLNLLLGLVFVLWSPIQQALLASAPPHYLWAGMAVSGVGVWTLTLLKGRRTYRLFRALEQHEEFRPSNL